ncbi:MAG: DUF1819 family protein [Trichococcus flocculiformis]|jgi:hypothetical protein|nr:DUF1819 family protein [Bacilli bacterium]
MNKYRTALMNRPFMNIESKRIAEMMLQGKSEEERRYEAVELNAIQMPSLDRRKTSYKEISHRLSFLDDFLLEKFMNSDADTAKAILAYAILQADQLYYEFMREIYLEKILLLQKDLAKKEVINFLYKKAEQSEVVAKWADNTKERLAVGFIQMMRESGFILSNHEEHQVKRPFINQSVGEYLRKNGIKPIVEIMLGELL